MYKIVRKAALELQTLDSSKVVKVAGILRRLKNVFKQLTDKEFSSGVDKIRNESMDLQSVSAQLNQRIDELLSSIKDGDVDAYDLALTQVKTLSVELTNELKQLNQEARKGRKELPKKQPESSNEATDPFEEPALDPDYVPQNDGRYGPDSFRHRHQTNFTQQKQEENPGHDIPISERLVNEKGRAAKFDSFEWFKNAEISVPPGARTQIITKLLPALNMEMSLDLDYAEKTLNAHWSEFESALINAIRNGAIITPYSTAKPGNKVERRNKGETKFDVQAQAFDIPGLGIRLSAKFGMNDLGMTGMHGRKLNVAHIKTGGKTGDPGFYLTTPEMGKKKKASARLEGLRAFALASQQVPYQEIKVDGLQLAKALFEGYRMVYGADPSLETLGAGWAQATFERPSQALPNYNIGNIRATPEWIKSGKPYFILGTVEVNKSGLNQVDKMAKWRAYETPAEGAAGYWKLLGGRYKDAVEWMAAGDPVSAAVIMGKKGYYTANIEKYAPEVGKIYKKFMEKIAPQLPMVKSSPQPPPAAEKPAVVDSRFSSSNESVSPSVKSETPSTNEADNLLGALFAMGPVEKLVTRSILENKLPKTDVVVSLGSLSAPFGMRLRFARAAANTLRDIIDADVSIHSDGNKIELQCSALGSTYAVASAVKALCDCVNVALYEKTQSIGSYSVAYNVTPMTISKYAELKV